MFLECLVEEVHASPPNDFCGLVSDDSTNLTSLLTNQNFHDHASLFTNPVFFSFHPNVYTYNVHLSINEKKGKKKTIVSLIFHSASLRVLRYHI